MEFRRLAIPDVMLMEPRAFADERGIFFESFSVAAFEQATGVSCVFVQDNHSISRKGVVRGLHYQLPPFGQGKLIRVVTGAAFDVAVDIRRGSPTFGKWVAETLSAENRCQLWIPDGFAHGFAALQEGTEVLYKTSAVYHQPSERAIAWNDPTLAIPWRLEGTPVISAKDRAAPCLRDADLP